MGILFDACSIVEEAPYLDRFVSGHNVRGHQRYTMVKLSLAKGADLIERGHCDWNGPENPILKAMLLQHHELLHYR